MLKKLVLTILFFSPFITNAQVTGVVPFGGQNLVAVPCPCSIPAEVPGVFELICNSATAGIPTPLFIALPPVTDVNLYGLVNPATLLIPTTSFVGAYNPVPVQCGMFNAAGVCIPNPIVPPAFWVTTVGNSALPQALPSSCAAILEAATTGGAAAGIAAAEEVGLATTATGVAATGAAATTATTEGTTTASSSGTVSSGALPEGATRGEKISYIQYRIEGLRAEMNAIKKSRMGLEDFGYIGGIPLNGQTNGTTANSSKYNNVGAEYLTSKVNFGGYDWARGQASWFGGQNDTSISSSERGAIGGNVLKNLDTNNSFYMAARFDYSQISKSDLKNKTFEAYNPLTGLRVGGIKVEDHGPNYSTGRSFDFSRAVLNAIGASTDDVIYLRPEN